MDVRGKIPRAVPTAAWLPGLPGLRLRRLHTMVVQRGDWSPTIHRRQRTLSPKPAPSVLVVCSGSQPDRSQRCSRWNCGTGSKPWPASLVPARADGPVARVVAPVSANRWLASVNQSVVWGRSSGPEVQTLPIKKPQTSPGQTAARFWRLAPLAAVRDGLDGLASQVQNYVALRGGTRAKAAPKPFIFSGLGERSTRVRKGDVRAGSQIDTAVDDSSPTRLGWL